MFYTRGIFLHMSSIKNNILYFIILSILAQVRSLVELPGEEAVEIVAVESSIRRITNGMFSALKLEDVKHKTRIKEYSTIHNFFVTITLQDQTNLREIAALVKVDNVDNKTRHFIAQVNEVLNEDNKSNEAKDDVYVTTHIETFIKKLEYLKDKYGFANNDPNFGINAHILQHLKEDASKNTTQERDDSDNNVLSDLDYWQPSGRRIFQGHREKITRFPFVASVQFFNKFQCGGSIIKSDLVITSASCLQLAWNNRFFRENPAFLSVQVGCELYEGGDENISIQEVYFHPDYDPKNLRNNLAIMRLRRVLRFGKRVKKVKKINFDREASPLPHNTDGITIIGWGAKSTTNVIGSVWSNRLSYAVLDFYPLKECQDVYSKDFVTYKNFCAGFFSKGGGACNRDVGGPGVAHGVLVGVVSFGSPNCGAPDSPTVFTKLGYYKKWIEEIMEMETRTGKARTTMKPTRLSFKVEHYLTTPSGYAVEPLTTTDMSNSETYQVTPIPIKSIDALRALNDNNMFKEFITTMFGSEEVKEYLDQFEYETDTDDEEKLNMEAQKVLDMIRINTGTTTVQTTPKTSVTEHFKAPTEASEDYKVGSVRMVTAIENFEELPKLEDSSDSGDSDDLETTPKLFIDYVDVPDSAEKVEEKIAKLIENIDIQELLKSDLGDSSADVAMKNKTETTPHVQTDKGIEMAPADDTNDSSDDDDDDDTEDLDGEDDNAAPEDLFLHLLDLTQKKTQHNKKQPHQQSLKQSEHPQKRHEHKQDHENKEKHYQQQQQQPQKQHHQKQKQQKANQQQQHQQKQQKANQQKPNKAKKHKQKVYQQQQPPTPGLGIQSTSFKDFTFRQNESSPGSILDIFSQSDLLRLLTEVVDDSAKGNATADDNNSGVW